MEGERGGGGISFLGGGELYAIKLKLTGDLEIPQMDGSNLSKVNLQCALW